jgi:hypothetical protein
MKKIHLVYLAFVVVLSSCEGFVVVNGYIKSSKDNSNVVNAKIELLDVPMQKSYDSSKHKIIDLIILSDSNGHFIAHSQMIGMVRPPKYRIRITKEGFKTEEIKFNYEKNGKDNRIIQDSLLVILEQN